MKILDIDKHPNKLQKTNVQVQMVGRTLSKIDNMKEDLQTKNRSEIVKTAIDIAAMVTDTLSKGGSVIMEDKSGNKHKIVIPGISK